MKNKNEEMNDKKQETEERTVEKGVTVQNKKEGSIASLLTIENIEAATKHASHLFNVLVTAKKINIKTKDDIVFSRDDVVKYTSMSHKEASQLFEALKLFGMLVWVDDKKKRFVLNIDYQLCLNTIMMQALVKADFIRMDIERYEGLLQVVEAEDSLKKQMFSYMKSEILKKMFGEDAEK